jgi:diguanylate cyclase (GGDEF)-like protein
VPSPLGEELRHRAAAVSGFAALIAEEAFDVNREVAEEHLARLAANVQEMRVLVDAWHNERDQNRAPLEPRPRHMRAVEQLSAGLLLVLEPDDDHFEMLRSLLSRSHGDVVWEVRRAQSLDRAMALLGDSEPRCALINLSATEPARGSAVSALRSLSPELPIVVLTGYPENGAGVQAVRDGAQDYLIQGSLTTDVLDRSLRYAVERSKVKSDLAHQALHDGLTGLPNRSLLLDRLAVAQARLDRTQGLSALMFIDLDRFKLVNDTMGHQVGDELLVAVAERLRTQTRKADMVARFGGDEFVLLVEDLAHESQIAGLADQLLRIFQKPFTCSSGVHQLAASVGVCVLKGTEVPAGVLLANADTAMYRAKELGRGQWALFDDGMHLALMRRMEVEQELTTALASGELTLRYQPLLDARSGQVVGAEALIRWDHPKLGQLQPAEFLSVAEDSGQIVSVGAWVITQACLQTRSWLDQGLVDESWTTWVNVSTRQLDRPGLEEAVAAALTLARLPASRLGLEITESAFIKDEQEATQLTGRLHELGVRLAVDDFGTGYSSMRRLRELPLDHLKIDGSFVADIACDPTDRAIVTACIDLARAMGITPVAEGVETEEQLEVLHSIGCDVTQGFLISRPLEPGQLRTWLLARELSSPLPSRP